MKSVPVKFIAWIESGALSEDAGPQSADLTITVKDRTPSFFRSGLGRVLAAQCFEEFFR
jgi:hypothetical protein